MGVSWRPKNIKISARFRTTSRCDREYLRTEGGTRHHQLENGVANYDHSPIHTVGLAYLKLNFPLDHIADPSRKLKLGLMICEIIFEVF